MSPNSFEHLFHQAPCGLLRTRSDGTIIVVNQTFCNWTGYSEDELIGEKRLRDLFNAGGRIFHHTHWLPLLQMQGSISEVKIDVVTREGETIPMVLNATLDPQGDDVTQLVSAFVARDRDQYERELLEARKGLQKSVEEATRLQEIATDRALLAEQMIGIVSHDLRNPLGTVALGIQTLEVAGLSGSQTPVVNRMRRSLRHANHLISDLLDFTEARLGGGLSASISACNLHEVVAEAVDNLQQLNPSYRLRCQRKGSGACEVDPTRIAQLVGNLVSNAVAYGAKDAPITITTTGYEDGCSISVHNEGEPIPPALQETIFSPMKRADSTPSATRSVGLGLYIVKMIASAHGGTVEVESTQENGTTFTVTLPARSDPASEE